MAFVLRVPVPYPLTPMSSDPRVSALREALDRFTERLGWLHLDWSPEESADLEDVRTILAEWADLEPHMELLEAMVGKPRLATVLDCIEKMRARVQMAFLFAVDRLLWPLLMEWLNEMLMRVPAVLKKPVPPELEPRQAMIRERLATMVGTVPDLETMFRQSMQAADNCEEESRAAYARLIKDWPDEWTDEMQTRLEALTLVDAQAWKVEIEAAQKDLLTRHPWMAR